MIAEHAIFTYYYFTIILLSIYMYHSGNTCVISYCNLDIVTFCPNTTIWPNVTIIANLYNIVIAMNMNSDAIEERSFPYT